MLYHAKNGTIHLDQTDMPYVRFGTGNRKLVILPGLGDGLLTVKGLALPMAWMYRAFAKDFTVYMFSRKLALPQGYTTRQMAQDVKTAIDRLGIPQADVMGVSMGGMIAQHLAIDYPEAVNRLVLVVTSARPNPTLLDSVQLWIRQAKQGDHTALMDSNLRRIYSEDYYRKNKWMVPITGKVSKPKSYDRFLVQAEACLHHDAYEHLGKIQANTLIIGGEKDNTLGPDAAHEIKAQLPNGELKLYPQWGHGLYDEAADFDQVVKQWLLDGK